MGILCSGALSPRYEAETLQLTALCSCCPASDPLWIRSPEICSASGRTGPGEVGSWARSCPWGGDCVASSRAVQRVPLYQLFAGHRMGKQRLLLPFCVFQQLLETFYQFFCGSTSSCCKCLPLPLWLCFSWLLQLQASLSDGPSSQIYGGLASGIVSLHPSLLEPVALNCVCVSSQCLWAGGCLLVFFSALCVEHLQCSQIL